MPTDKNIKTPEALYKLFEGYKSWCKDNPRIENMWSNKLDCQVSIERERAMTWDGFNIYLRSKSILSRLDDYKANKDDRYASYAYIIRAIDDEIKEDKFTGAVAGIYQHNIIARDLGLVDKVDQNNTTKQTINIKVDDDLNDTLNNILKE